MEMDKGLIIDASAQMQVNSSLRQILKQNRELVGVTVQQARIYGNSRTFLAGDPVSRDFLERFETHVIESNDPVQVTNTIAEPMAGKTHEWTERLGRANFNAPLIRRGLEAGKKIKGSGFNTTTIAEDLSKLQDHKGNPLVWHRDASEWVPEERTRIGEAIVLTAQRVHTELPRLEPEYQHIVSIEWLIAFLDGRGVPQSFPNTFNQFRMTVPKAQEDASIQRTDFRNGKIPAEVVGHNH